MEYFADLDVSMAETHVCVVTGNGVVVHEVKLRYHLRLPISRPSLPRFRAAGGSYSGRAEWLRCSTTA
jgi:hypothetical protein